MKWRNVSYMVGAYAVLCALLIVAGRVDAASTTDCTSPRAVRNVWQRAAVQQGVSLEWYQDMRDGELRVVENKLSNIAGEKPPYQYDRIDVMRSTGGGLVVFFYLDGCAQGSAKTAIKAWEAARSTESRVPS